MAMCVDRFDLRGGDLPNGNVAATNATMCEALCFVRADCSAYSFHRASPCSDHGEKCPFADGCCSLKNAGDMAPEQSGGLFPNINKCSCSAIIRLPSPPPAQAMQHLPPTNAVNVLHIMIDDLRAELPGPYHHDFVHAPHIRALSAAGTVFTNAFCQISVCSPSRISFLTGRRPTTTRSFNFLDHFRQANCGIHTSNASVVGGRAIGTAGASIHWQGGSGQCCTSCTLTKGCDTWSWNETRPWVCTLYAGGRVVRGGGVGRGLIAGHAGQLNGWVSLPQAFKNAGWVTMSSGKIFHTEQGGSGPTPALTGVGMPPNQDPPSWTYGLSSDELWRSNQRRATCCSPFEPHPFPVPSCAVSNVNEVAPMDDRDHTCSVGATSSACEVAALEDGTLLKNKTSENDGEFEDRIIASDAILKLRLASRIIRQEDGGSPFFLAVGFRKPHLCFRSAG